MALTPHLGRNVTWFESFRFRDFRLLWSSTFLHSMARGMDQVALGWLVFEMTGSPFMVALSAAARQSPFFFLGVMSGTVADWVDRRVFLRLITLGAGLAAALMAVILLTDVVEVWHVMGLAVVSGSFFTFTQTVRQVYTHDIVGRTRALNGLSLTMVGNQFGAIAGSMVGGALIFMIGVGEQYVVVGVGYAVAAAVLLATSDVGREVVARRESLVRSLIGAINLMRGNPTLMTLMFITGTVAAFGFTYQSLLPVFAKDVLGLGAGGLGIITAGGRAGGMIGLILVAGLGDFRHKGRLILIASTASGLGLIALSASSNIFIFIGIQAVAVACLSATDPLAQTLMQSNVPDEQRGRSMGAWVLSLGIGPVGQMGIGAIATVLTAPIALLTYGGVLAFISLASAVGLPRLRRLE